MAVAASSRRGAHEEGSVTASNTEAKIETIREQMPAVTRYAYLNTGTYGPLPRVSIDAITAYADHELEEGRISPQAGYARASEVKTNDRTAIARFFDTRPENIALTRHTTDGMNVGIFGVNWQPGDELILSDMEHPGGQLPAYNVARRYGVNLRIAHLGDGTGDVAGKIEQLISPRTRMLVVSHLTWNTGTVLPLAEIIEMARRRHVLVVVDAAQSAGSLPVNLEELGVDVYAGPGQKWMCGPEGTGFVYVSNVALEQLQQTFVGYASVGAMEHAGGYFTPKRNADRFEVGGISTPVTLGQATSLDWIRETVGLDWAYRRIAKLGQYTWERLAALDGASLITPRQQMAGLVSFKMDGFEPPAIVEQLAERGVVIRSIADPASLRVSTGFYNSEEDIDRLVGALEDIRRSAKS